MNRNVRIDRLSLRVPGLDEDAARDLARLVALKLADGAATSSRSSRYNDNAGTTLRLEAGARADLDGLAWQIAGEVWRAIEQESARAGGTA